MICWLTGFVCGRFVGNFSVADVVDELLNVGVPSVSVEEGLPAEVSNFNTPPTAKWPIAIMIEGTVHLRLAIWGLVPPWSKDAGVGSKMINARSETVTEKPSFRNLVPKHRAIIPMNGFYEWDRSDAKHKRPFYVSRKDGRMMWVAGLWNVSPILGGATTFTMITRDSLDDLAFVHDRSPVQLEIEDGVEWMSADAPPLELLSLSEQPRLAPFEVDPRVNSVRNNDADLICPVEPDTLF